jgi:hypothetical protein
MFNVRKEKVKFLDEFTTLDIAHKKVAKKFKSKRKKLPELKSSLDRVNHELNIINNFNRPLNSNEQIKRCSLLQEKQTLIDDIFAIENNIDEINYYDLVDEPLLQYYESFRKVNVDEKEIDYDPTIHSKDMKSNDTRSYEENYDPNVYKKKKTPQKRRLNEDRQNKSILDYFNPPTISTPNKEDKVISKKKFYDEYRFLVDPNYRPSKRSLDDMLKCECGGCKLLVHGEGILVCDRCGETDLIFEDSDAGIQHDNLPDKPSYCYKKINHFREWLSQFQAKESTDIPSNVFEKILDELNKMNFIDMTKINIPIMKEILKSVKLPQYYEHTAFIIHKITGIPPPTIPREKEEMMIDMFKLIQAPFEKHRPADRANFLSYAFILRKFCELLELDDFISCFPLLKSREKLLVQDNIWKKICEDLEWQYIPTI